MRWSGNPLFRRGLDISLYPKGDEKYENEKNTLFHIGFNVKS